MSSFPAQESIRRWRLALLPFQAIMPVTFMVLLFSGSTERASHIVAAVVHLCLGCSAALLIGGVAAVVRTHDRRLMWSAFGFAIGGILMASLLWGSAFPPATKGL